MPLLRADSLERIAAEVSRALAFLASLALLAVAFLVVGEIVARSVFRLSVLGASDLSALIVAVAVSAAFPVATSRRGHLTVEFLRERLGPRCAAVLVHIGGWLLVAGLVLLAWRIGATALEFGRRGAVTEVVRLPMAPFYWAIAGLLSLSALLQALLQAKEAIDWWRHRQTLRGWREVLPVAAGLAVIAYLAIVVFGGPATRGLLVPASPLLVALVAFALMWTGAVILFPLGFVMLLTGFAGVAVLLDANAAHSLVGTRTLDLLSNDVLLIIPLFILMGSFAQAGGLSEDLYRLAHALVGRLRGGLALATIGACAGFGAMTGSSIATTLTVGSAAYPEMRRHGYSQELSTGSIAAGGTLGQLVPPSAVMILYALLTETSVGGLFIAAALPALLIIALFAVSISLQVRFRPAVAPEAVKPVPGEFGRALAAAWPSLLLICAVLGGIYGGVFTVTEAASVGAIGAFFLALARRRLGGEVMTRVMIETAERTAMIYALIIGGSIFAFFVGLTQLPVEATALLSKLALPGVAVVCVALVIYILLGMVMEPFAVMIITVPVVAPIIDAFGFDLIWWGIVMVLVVEIGLLTPPFGMNAFVLKAVAADVPLGRVFRGVVPFVFADLIGLALLVAFPAIVLWLPRLLQ